MAPLTMTYRLAYGKRADVAVITAQGNTGDRERHRYCCT